MGVIRALERDRIAAVGGAGEAVAADRPGGGSRSRSRRRRSVQGLPSSQLTCRHDAGAVLALFVGGAEVRVLALGVARAGRRRERDDQARAVREVGRCFLLARDVGDAVVAGVLGDVLDQPAVVGRAEVERRLHVGGDVEVLEAAPVADERRRRRASRRARLVVPFHLVLVPRAGQAIEAVGERRVRRR